jgi:hypothetical protein
MKHDFSAPGFVSGNETMDLAFQIAIGDLSGNIVPFRAGILKMDRPCLMAGLDYRGPWTRDAAINTWNGCGLLFPAVTRDTLLSELEEREGALTIRGQYWDAIIWVVGAWHQYLYDGNREFLATAFEVTRNALAYYERTEFDGQTGLFRGPAVYGDGIAAYPDRYAVTEGGSPCILHWPGANPSHRSGTGYGVPMQSRSRQGSLHSWRRCVCRNCATVAWSLTSRCAAADSVWGVVPSMGVRRDHSSRQTSPAGRTCASR